MSEDTFRESEDLSKITRQDEINEFLRIENRKLQDKITALTDELGTVKEILRQLNNRDKRLQDEALRGREANK